MTALEFLLDGLEAELELERELGVRAVEIDRSLLAPVADARRESQVAALDARRETRDERGARDERRGTRDVALDVGQETRDERQETRRPNPTLRDPNQTLRDPNRPYDFVFLHDRPLSPGGIEMMAKIVTAMKKTPETAPIVFTGARPAARIYVVLGDGARKKWFPMLNGAPGKWLRGPGGEDVLVTYSPEYILRFGPVTPAVKKIKVEMWTSLKGVMQRVGS